MTRSIWTISRRFLTRLAVVFDALTLGVLFIPVLAKVAYTCAVVVCFTIFNLWAFTRCLVCVRYFRRCTLFALAVFFDVLGFTLFAYTSICVLRHAASDLRANAAVFGGINDFG